MSGRNQTGGGKRGKPENYGPASSSGSASAPRVTNLRPAKVRLDDDSKDLILDLLCRFRKLRNSFLPDGRSKKEQKREQRALADEGNDADDPASSTIAGPVGGEDERGDDSEEEQISARKLAKRAARTNRRLLRMLVEEEAATLYAENRAKAIEDLRRRQEEVVTTREKEGNSSQGGHQKSTAPSATPSATRGGKGVTAPLVGDGVATTKNSSLLDAVLGEDSGPVKEKKPAATTIRLKLVNEATPAMKPVLVTLNRTSIDTVQKFLDEFIPKLGKFAKQPGEKKKTPVWCYSGTREGVVTVTGVAAPGSDKMKEKKDKKEGKKEKKEKGEKKDGGIPRKNEGGEDPALAEDVPFVPPLTDVDVLCELENDELIVFTNRSPDAVGGGLNGKGAPVATAAKSRNVGAAVHPPPPSSPGGDAEVGSPTAPTPTASSSCGSASSAVVGQPDASESDNSDSDDDDPELAELKRHEAVMRAQFLKTHRRRQKSSELVVPPEHHQHGAALSDQSLLSTYSASQHLPAYSQREKLVQTINKNRVTVVTGATGSGKSTQIPQFLLDDMLLKNPSSERNLIVVCQPRRIAALGLADRVSEERVMGLSPPSNKDSSKNTASRARDLIGYSVRLDRKFKPGKTKIIYVTTGILLNMLLEDPLLSTVKHLIVDEVHERSLHIDFIVTLVREKLVSSEHQTRVGDFRLTLMSATIESAKFVDFFGAGAGFGEGVAVGEAHIPGRTFPVETRFLEETLEFCRLSGSRALEFVAGRGGGKGGGKKGGKKFDPPYRGGGADHSEEECCVEEDDDDFETWLAETFGIVQNPNIAGGASPSEPGSAAGAPPAVRSFLSPECEEPPDYDLIEQLVRKIAERPSASDNKQKGQNADCPGILIFLPGALEISKLCDQLERIRSSYRLDVLPLHGALSNEQQRKVFQIKSHTTVPVVVATNIAETSITVDCITDVIDSGLMRESRFDVGTNMTRLATVYVSHANAAQRAGRAGRVRAGRCWRLYPKRFFESNLPGNSLPELKRTPLDELVLFLARQFANEKLSAWAERERGEGASSKQEPTKVDLSSFCFACDQTAIPNFLARTPDPPQLPATLFSIRKLIDLGALREHRSPSIPPQLILTPLGYHLSALPVDVQVGKLLILGCLLFCPDTALSVAAAVGNGRSPFLKCDFATAEGREMLARREEDFLLRSGGDDTRTHKKEKLVVGDQLLLANAVTAYCRDVAWGTWKDRSEWCRWYGVSISGMESIGKLRENFQAELVKAGFLSRSSITRNGVVKEAGKWAVTSPGSGSAGPSGDDSRPAQYLVESPILVSAALAAAFYPHVAQVQKTKTGSPSGGKGKKGKGKHPRGGGGTTKIRFICLDAVQSAAKNPDRSKPSSTKMNPASDTKINVDPAIATPHPSSLHWPGRAGAFGPPSNGESFFHVPLRANHDFLVYHKKMRTTNLYLFDSTVVDILVLLLFGGKKLRLQLLADVNSEKALAPRLKKKAASKNAAAKSLAPLVLLDGGYVQCDCGDRDTAVLCKVLRAEVEFMLAGQISGAGGSGGGSAVGGGEEGARAAAGERGEEVAQARRAQVMLVTAIYKLLTGNVGLENEEED